MKYISLIFLALLITIDVSLSQYDFFEDYQIIRVSTNFNGISFNDNAIIAYGDAGVICRSSNRGRNWEQINLNDSLNILDMVNVGSSFYGISNKRYLIFSNDNGKHWNLKDFVENTELYKIFYYNSKIYVLLKNRIWALNENLDNLKEYFAITDSAYYDGCLVGNKIVYSSGKGKLSFINLDNEQRGSIDLASLGLCINCPVPIRLFSNAIDKIYFILGNKLYQYDFTLNSAKYVYQPLKLTNAPFYAENDNVYQIFTVKFADNNIDSMYFGKVDKTIGKFIHLKHSSNDRYIVNLAIKDLKFLSSDTLIAVGNGKLIYMSYNGGKNWELKSLLNEFSHIFLFDNSNARIIAPKVRFFSTTDGGVTWLPQKNFHPVYVRNYPFFQTARESKRFYKNKDLGFFFGESFMQEFDTNFIYTYDGGQNIAMKKIKNLQHISNETVPLLVTHKGKTIFVTQREFQGNPYYLIFDKLNDNMEIESRVFHKDIVFYSIFDYNDTLFAIGRSYNQGFPYKYGLFISTDTANTWESVLSFNTDIKFLKKELQNINFATRIDNFIIFSWDFHELLPDDIITHNRVYIIDLHKKTFKEIYDSKKEMLIRAIKLGDKYICLLSSNIDGSSRMIFTKDLTSNPIVWNEFNFNRFSPPLFNITEDRFSTFYGFLSDSLFVYVSYDSLFKQLNLFYARKKINVSVIDDFKTNVISKIYIHPPKPIPARDFVRAMINFNQEYDINQADIRLYDMLGRVVYGKDSFAINLINNYTAEVIFNVSPLSAATYFIVISLGGETRSSVIIVE